MSDECKSEEDVFYRLRVDINFVAYHSEIFTNLEYGVKLRDDFNDIFHGSGIDHVCIIESSATGLNWEMI